MPGIARRTAGAVWRIAWAAVLASGFEAPLAVSGTTEGRPLSHAAFSELMNRLEGAAADEVVADITGVIEREVVNTHALAALHYRRGMAYCELGEHESAVKDFDQAILRYPGYVAAFLFKAWAQMQAGSPGAALLTLERASFHTRDPSIPLARGLVLLQSGRLEQALALLNQAIGEDTRDQRLFFVRSLILEQLGQGEEARRDRARAGDYNGILPGFMPASRAGTPGTDAAPPALSRAEAGVLYEQAGREAAQRRFIKAGELLDEILLEHPDHGRSRLLRARIALDTGRHSAAIDDLTRLLDLLPGQSLLLRMRAEAYYGASRYAEAIRDYQAVLEQHPDDPEASGRIRRIEREAASEYDK